MYISAVTSPRNPIEECDPDNITFLFLEYSHYISWDIANYNTNCRFKIDISHCPPLETDPCTIHITHIDENHVTASLDECVQTGEAITVDVYLDDPKCKEDDNTCRSQSIYIPHVKPAGKYLLFCFAKITYFILHADLLLIANKSVVVDLSNDDCNIEHNLANSMTCFVSRINNLHGCVPSSTLPRQFKFNKRSGKVHLEGSNLSTDFNGTQILVFCPSLCENNGYQTRPDQILILNVILISGKTVINLTKL